MKDIILVRAYQLGIMRGGNTLHNALENAYESSFFNFVQLMLRESQEEHQKSKLSIPARMDMCWSKFIELDRDRIVYYERDTKFKDHWKELLQLRKEEFGEMAKISPIYKRRLKEFYENEDNQSTSKYI